MDKIPRPLNSAWMKIEWAKRHLDLFYGDQRAFYQDDDKASGRNDDPNRPAEFRHEPFQIPPIPVWSLMIGDAVHNMRCALDHLANALAVQFLAAHNVSRQRKRQTAFPLLLAPNAGNFANVTADIEPAARQEIDALQPYNRRNCLWILREISNADKHHQLTIPPARIMATGPLTIGGGQTVEIGLADGRVISPDPTTGRATPYFQPKMAMSISLEITLPESGETVNDTRLAEVHDFISSNVLPRFTRFFP